MRIQIENKVSLILILIASASLASMVATLNIDHIVNHDLYYYGLQFTTKWAAPYWTMTAIVFSMGWLIIITSIVFELHLALQRFHKLPEPDAENLNTHKEMVQNETSKIETEPNDKPKETEVKTTPEEEAKTKTSEEEAKTMALVVKTEDDLSELRVLIEGISVSTNVPVTGQKADDSPTNDE